MRTGVVRRAPLLGRARGLARCGITHMNSTGASTLTQLVEKRLGQFACTVLAVVESGGDFRQEGLHHWVLAWLVARAGRPHRHDTWGTDGPLVSHDYSRMFACVRAYVRFQCSKMKLKFECVNIGSMSLLHWSDFRHFRVQFTCV